jgi:hypothetical protein
VEPRRRHDAPAKHKQKLSTTERAALFAVRQRKSRAPALKDLKRASVRDSIDWLATTLIHNVEEAVAVLYFAHNQITLFRLYAEYFPKEYSESTSPAWPSRDAIKSFQTEHSEFHMPHSPREHEFFDLINQHLFYCSTDYLDMAGRLDFIPICSAYQDYTDHDPDNFRPALQLAGAILTNGQWTTPEAVVCALTGDDSTISPPQLPGSADWKEIEPIFRRQPAPLCFFLDTLAIITHSTGNVFLDHECQYGDCADFDWSRDSIEFLKTEGAAEHQISNRMVLFDEWLTAAPAARSSQILTLWNKAVLRTAQMAQKEARKKAKR